MRLRILELHCLLACLAAGCSTPSTSETQETFGRAWIGDAFHRASIDRAILTQRTLYPFHFHAETAELNALGRQDLEVLAEHLVEHPGTVHLHRGAASDALFTERADAVALALVEAGVQPGDVRIGENAPGGPGIAGPRVIEETERARTDSLEREEEGSTSLSTIGE